MNAFATLHPDDLLFFQEVSAAMRRIAKTYELPLKSIEPFPTPEYRTSPLGDCSSNGTVRLVLRGMVNGHWDTEPRREEDVWNTAAHELAHLRYMNHGAEFQAFEVEMREAVSNQREDPTQKILNKLVKLQATRQSEAEIGNTAAAEAFAGMINKLLIDHELNASDIEYAKAQDKDPVIEVRTDLDKYRIETKRIRIAWQESLARIVANGHLCTFLIHTGSNRIVFVGTKSHATVAEYVYGTLVPLVDKMSFEAAHAYRMGQRKAAGTKGRSPKEWLGFREAWITAFVKRIGERFAAVREKAVTESVHSSSTSLIRLEGALVRVRAYMDDKFGRKQRYANALHSRAGQHPEGLARGRAAADRITLGQKGVAGRERKQLT